MARLWRSNFFEGIERMSITNGLAQNMAQFAIAAVGRGDFAAAIGTLFELVERNEADASAYICLSYAYRGLKDVANEVRAIDTALQLEPQNIVALICKADQLDASGDQRHASTYYRAAINQAATRGNLPEPIAHEVARCKAMCEQYQRQFHTQLQHDLDSLAHSASGSASRFKESLDLLTGKKQIYHQQPKIYYFPGLAQTQFFDNSAFPWLSKLELACSDIREECLAVMRDPDALRPYVQSTHDRPQRGGISSLTNNANWSAFHLWKDGKIVRENALRCPKTLEALEDVPFTQMRGRSPSVMFSVLRPGTRIPPHHGLVNTRLICHLPLIVPGRCGLRVGNESREVVTGKAWVFDDTMEHEAWNLSDDVRVVLLFEIWRPELSHQERSLVRSMFAAIDQYQGPSSAWSEQ